MTGVVSGSTAGTGGSRADARTASLATASRKPPTGVAGPHGGRYVAAASLGQALTTLDRLEAGELAAGSVSFGPCTLYPSPIRLRSNGWVGTKPQTKCSAAVTSINHSTDMRYKFLIWWRLKGTRTAGNQGQSSLQQKNVEFACDSDEETGWGSTTLGTVVYGGKTYYARVYPERVSLDCGG